MFRYWDGRSGQRVVQPIDSIYLRAVAGVPDHSLATRPARLGHWRVGHPVTPR